MKVKTNYLYEIEIFKKRDFDIEGFIKRLYTSLSDKEYFVYVKEKLLFGDGKSIWHLKNKNVHYLSENNIIRIPILDEISLELSMQFIDQTGSFYIAYNLQEDKHLIQDVLIYKLISKKYFDFSTPEIIEWFQGSSAVLLLGLCCDLDYVRILVKESYEQEMDNLLMKY